MANTASAKKAALQNEKRRVRNVARRTAIKTAVKKVLNAVEQAAPAEQTETLFRDAQAKMARAKGKGLMHANTVSRKLSRLAKRIAKANAAK